MRKNLITLRQAGAAGLAVLLAAGALAGCGGSGSTAASGTSAAASSASDSGASAASSSASSTSSDASSASEETSAASSGAAADDQEETVVRVAARYENVEIWEAVNKELEDEHIRVECSAYDSSVNLNDLLIAGEVDMNVAQHYAYLELLQAGTESDKYQNLISLGEIGISTIDLYSNKYDSIDELPDGATIAIPNDQMNGGRALGVLEKAGLLELADTGGDIPAQTDIISNPKNLKFEEIASSSMISILDDVDAGFAYSPNAVDANLDPTVDPIFRDELDLKNNPTQHKFVIIFTGEEGDENNEIYQKVIEAYHTPAVFKVYKEVYKGATIPVVDGEPIDLSQY